MLKTTIFRAQGQLPLCSKTAQLTPALLEKRNHNSFLQNKGADPPKLMMRAVLGIRDGSEQAWAETDTGTEKGKKRLASQSCWDPPRSPQHRSKR